MTFYHICSKEEWEARQGEFWSPESFSKVGFIHLSFKGQLKDTLQRHFKGIDNLICLEIYISENDTNLRLEFVPARNQMMPHYYGLIKTDWVKVIEQVE